VGGFESSGDVGNKKIVRHIGKGLSNHRRGERGWYNIKVMERVERREKMAGRANRSDITCPTNMEWETMGGRNAPCGFSYFAQCVMGPKVLLGLGGRSGKG